MNHRFIRSIKTKGRFSELWLPLCFIAVLVFFYIVYPTVLGNLFSRAALPFWSGKQFFMDTFHEASLFLTSKHRLVQDVERLSAALEQAKTLVLDRELLREENIQLKEQFGRTRSEGERLLGAIIVRPPQSVYDTAVIDIGSTDGVREGDFALSGSAVLGVVRKTFTHTSLVEFFSTAGEKTSVSILHEGGAIPAEAEGRGGGEFNAVLPKEVTVFVGDSVIMPKINPFMFAVVEAIDGDDTDSFQTVRFKNPVSIQSLRFLEILRPTIGE